MGLDVRMKLHNPTAQQVHEINEWIRKRHLNDRLYPEYNQFHLSKDGNAYFESLWRYWSPAYPRGPWPKIYVIMRKAIHMELELYYTNDCSDSWEIGSVYLQTTYWQVYLENAE